MRAIHPMIEHFLLQVNAKIKKDDAPDAAHANGNIASPRTKPDMVEFQKNYKRSVSQVQSRIASDVRISKAQGRVNDPWGMKSGTLVLDNRKSSSASRSEKPAVSQIDIPNVVVLGVENATKDVPTAARDDPPASAATAVPEDNRKKHPRPTQTATSDTKRGSTKRQIVRAQKAERRKGKNQDPFDFDFQLVIAEDMHHLLDTNQETSQLPWLNSEDASEENMAHAAPVPATSGTPPAGSPTRVHARSSQSDEPLTSKIELLRQQCEDGLGMDVFQAAYSALREQPSKGEGDFNAEVIEFLPDLRTLIKCEDIVYA